MVWFLEKVGLGHKQKRTGISQIAPVEQAPAPKTESPVKRAVEEALKKSRWKIIVYCDGVDPEEIIRIYTKGREDCHISSVQDLLDKTYQEGIRPPRGTNTWIITGYSRELQDSNIQREDKLQGIVREQMGQHVASQLIILSSTIPHELFQNVKLPWHNGPFEIEDPVWSIKKDDNALVLTKFKIHKFWDMTVPDQPKTEYKWVEEANYRFE